MCFQKRGDNSVIKSNTDMALGKNVGLMMVSMCVKFHEDSMNSSKVMAKVKNLNLG